jgi:hypothetical protein
MHTSLYKFVDVTFTIIPGSMGHTRTIGRRASHVPRQGQASRDRLGSPLSRVNSRRAAGEI